MKYTRIPEDTFKQIQMNAGVIVENFNPATGEASGLVGATTGGIQFSAAPTYTDFGDDIDNCPKNMKELKKLESYEITMSGTFVTVTAASAKMLAGAADVDSNNAAHIVPRNDLSQSDFKTLWWVGDYSDKNSGATAGFCAIKMENVLSTGGFQIQSTDKAKGQFAFTFTAHYSMDNQDKVPFEIYVKADQTATPSVLLDVHALTLTDGDTYTFDVEVVPEGTSVTLTSGSTSVATISGKTITAEGTGSTIITATITVDGVTYTDTCTVIVEAAE